MNEHNFINIFDSALIQSLNQPVSSMFFPDINFLPLTPPQQTHYQPEDQGQIPNNTPLSNDIKDSNYSIETNSYDMNSRQCVFPFSLPAEHVSLLMTPSQSTETCSSNAINLSRDFGNDFSLYPQSKPMEESYSCSLYNTNSDSSSSCNNIYVYGYMSPRPSCSPQSCYEQYPTNTNSTSNNKKQQTSSKKPYSCGLCQKPFGRKQEVQRHQVCHTKERNFSCTLCPKSFARRDAMQRHLKSHFKEKKDRRNTTRFSRT